MNVHHIQIMQSMCCNQLDFQFMRQSQFFSLLSLLLFLGFMLDSKTMTVSISAEKVAKLLSMVHELLQSDRIVIERLAQVIA